MKISLNWIKEFVDIPMRYSAKMLAELLTLRTCEVEGYEDQGRGLEGVVIGEILEFSKHPNADKLNVAKVDIGRKQSLQLIFGQMVTMHVGDRIPVAVAPTVLPTGIKIEAKDLRGIQSEGMLCLEQELGMKETGVSLLYFTKTKPGTPLAKALDLDDIIFEIDNKSLTHRPDLWGHYGMAREFAAFLSKKLKPFVARNPVINKGPSVKIEIQKREIAARFLSAIITGIKIEPSPMWMQNRLRAVGMRPVNNIVDITNYVMHELGHPLHAFDRRVVAHDHFVIRFAAEGEIIETLDHKKRTLTAEDALVTNGKKALGIAGVMGGLNSEVKNDTAEILLEAAAWNPIMIRKTATRHGLRSDAAQRFEKSLDPEITGIAFHRACELILQLCKTARFAGPVTDLYPAKQKVRKLITVSLNPSRVNKKIGVEIEIAEMEKHLKALEFGVKRAGGGLRVTIPTFRATKDINIEDDLVEEIARMHGYEKIPPALPKLPIKLPQENRERLLKHEARQILSLGIGFTETSHYSFYGLPEIRKCLLPEAAHLLIDNPLNNDQTHLRVSLLPHLLKSIALNLYHHENFKLYEIGRTYIKSEEYFPQEEKFICGVMVRKTRHDKEIFYDALGALQTFLDQFGIKTCIDESKNPPPYAHPAKCAAVKIGNGEIAAVYEVHPQVLKNFGVEANCAAFEINFTKLAAAGQEPRAYRAVPRFPGIEIDISVLIPKQTPVREILELIRHADQKLIAGIRLIDIFEDKSFGPDKKSFTFRILLQSPDRTLTDEEMKEVQERVFKTLRDSGFSIRGL